MSLSPGESSTGGGHVLLLLLHPRLGKGSNDTLSQTTGTGTAWHSHHFPSDAAEEPQGLHVFIPLFLISPASALPGDCLFHLSPASTPGAELTSGIVSSISFSLLKHLTLCQGFGLEWKWSLIEAQLRQMSGCPQNLIHGGRNT